MDTRIVVNVNKILFEKRNTRDNGTCSKSKKFKKFCAGENLKRIRGNAKKHTGIGLVERGIQTIKSTTRANLEEA